MGLKDKIGTIFGLICNEKGYTNLFKASVYLTTFYLVSAFNVLDKSLPIEFQAVEYKAKVEYKLKQEISFKDLQCNLRSETYVDCVKAKHRHGLNSSILKGLEAVHFVTEYLLYITSVLTIVGFFGSPFLKRESSTDKTKTISFDVVVEDKKYVCSVSHEESSGPSHY